MQTRRQATCEVSLDFLLSIVVNLLGQRLVYGTLATAERMTVFAVVVLAVAYTRRMVTRRFFNTLVPVGQRQSPWHSGLEAVSDTVLGLLITYGLQVLFYGAAATVIRAGGLTLGIYGLTMLRRYIIRRLFVRLEVEMA
jgi:hypothetical protein